MMLKTRYRLAGCIFLIISTACATDFETSELPLGAHFVIPVSVAGKDVQFLLDTGAPRSVVSTSMKELLGLHSVAGPSRSITDATGLQRNLRSWVRTPSLQVGAIPFDDCDMIELPLGDWFSADGILGLDVVRSLAWIFDPEAGLLVTTGKDQLESELARRQLAICERLPLHVDATRNEIFIDTLCNGEMVTLRIDTGTQTTSLTRRIVERLQLPDGTELALRRREQATERIRLGLEQEGIQATVTAREGAFQSIGVHGQPRRTTSYHLERLKVGGRTFCDLCVSVRPELAKKAASDQENLGLLGLDVLGGMAWALDWNHSELLIITSDI